MKSLLSELQRDLFSAQAFPALFCGLIGGVVMLVLGVSMVAGTFSGSLSPYFSSGAGLVLFSYLVTGMVLALGSGFKGAVAGPPIPSFMMLFEIASAIDLEGRALFMTVVVAALVGTVATGLFFLLMGRFRLANLFRFIPYPVAGGFMAGTGGLACKVALGVVGVSFDGDVFSSALTPEAAASVALGGAYGVGLFVASKIWKSVLILPISFIVAAAAFQGGLMAFDLSGDEARAAGFLFSTSSAGGLWPPFAGSDLAYIDWKAFAGQIPNLLILITVTLVCVVMHLGGLEVATKVELNWNREFRATGWANLAAGFGGAPPGCLLALACVRSVLFGATTRLAGVFNALALRAALLLGDTLLQLFPAPLVAGVLLLVGLRMLDDWLVGSRHRLAWTDHGIIVLMFVAIVFFGFLEGVGIGLLVTGIFFVVSLSRVDAIDSRFTLREQKSKKFRPVPDRAILLAAGERVHAYRLHGYLFFGSAYRLVDRLKQSLYAHPTPLCILLSFSRVSGLDYSAVHALTRFFQAAHDASVSVVAHGVSRRLETEFMRGLPPSTGEAIIVEPNEDRALERCEEIVIAKWKSELQEEESARLSLRERVVDEFERHLDRQVMFEELLCELEQWLDPCEYAPGEALVTLGQPRNGLQLLLEGTASQFDAAGSRLIQYAAGDVIEPRGAFGLSKARTSTIADERCRTLVLSRAKRLLLQETEPQHLLNLYKYVLTAESPAEG